MTRRASDRRTRLAHASFALLTLLALGLRGSSVRAQSNGQYAAWYGLMLSPVGALPPVARNGSDGDPWPNEFSVRLGYWRYDLNDVGHSNLGLTYGRRFDAVHTIVALTGAKMMLACGGCDYWLLGGADIQSTVWDRHFAGSAERPLAASLGLRETVGGARSSDSSHANAVSAGVALVFGLDVPTPLGSYVRLSLMPGYGYGRFVSVDLNDHGILPSVGGGLAWTSNWGIGVNVGYQRVIMAGAPAEGGIGLVWHFGARGVSHAPQPVPTDASAR